MSSALQRRIEQLEQRSPAESNQLNVVMGYIQHLPPKYYTRLAALDRPGRMPLRVGGVEEQRRRTTKQIRQTFCVSS